MENRLARPRDPGRSAASNTITERVLMRSMVEKKKEFQIHNRQSTWLWLSAAVSFVAGFLLVLNDSGAGWFLIILGIIHIGAATRPGQGLAVSNPKLVWLGVVGVTLLLVLLAVVVGAVLRFK
jgi:hypothetical protein